MTLVERLKDQSGKIKHICNVVKGHIKQSDVKYDVKNIKSREDLWSKNAVLAVKICLNLRHMQLKIYIYIYESIKIYIYI